MFVRNILLSSFYHAIAIATFFGFVNFTAVAGSNESSVECCVEVSLLASLHPIGFIMQCLVGVEW